jgi:hypothetical protein
MDTETYPNFFLCSLKRLDTGAIVEFEQSDDKDLDTARLLQILTSGKYEFITFNGWGYDVPILRHALFGAGCESIKRASDAIIVDGLTHWNFPKKFGCVDLPIDMVDLIEVAKGDCSLKLYAGRLHAKKMQDLPYEPDRVLTAEERAEVRLYCRNDLANTELLCNQLKPQIDQRRLMSVQYGIDLRSKSDAQIAEAVIKSEVEKLSGRKITKTGLNIRSFHYDIPDFITFKSEQMNDVMQILRDNAFTVKDNGVVQMPDALASLKVTLGETTYQMGAGGLHSTEKERFIVVGDGELLMDWDAASFYPALLINNGLYPSSMGEFFMQVFVGIRDDRVEAKRRGDKVVADLKKILVNSVFGKLGSVYSIFYAPKMMMQVTVTGQLLLLLLIERLESLGVSVVSANTDGIVIHTEASKESIVVDTMRSFERHANLEMERTDYKSMYQRDVNSYITFKPDGKTKTKGFFAPTSLEKNPQNEICVDAVIAYLKDGTPFEQTVRNCVDIRKFVSVIRVTGGAVKDDEYLGKVVRFYNATGVSGCIQRKQNGNTVPRSTGAKPLMNLPDELPDDINYDWYIRECENLLYDLGVKPRPVPIKLPRKNSKEWKQLFADGMIIEYEGKFIHVDDTP